MPRKDKVIHISNLPSTFRGNVTRNRRFIQNGIPPLGGAYDKVAKSTGLIRLGNEFLYNGVNNLVSKDFNKESFPSDDELGPTFPFNIIQTPRSNGKNLPQKQYAVSGKIPNVVAGGIAQPLGNNFSYMNGTAPSQYVLLDELFNPRLYTLPVGIKLSYLPACDDTLIKSICFSNHILNVCYFFL